MTPIDKTTNIVIKLINKAGNNTHGTKNLWNGFVGRSSRDSLVVGLIGWICWMNQQDGFVAG